MYLERLLQINMATLAALGALLLGMGQRSEGPPLLVILAAASAVWLTDVTGRIRIGRWTANVLMIVGAVVSLSNLYPPRSEMQTIGLSWFLIYLQIILLFQEKDEWKYWLLVMLSLLEVVMATLFSQGIWFGLLLGIYMLFGFSAMTLLMLYRQRSLFAKGAEIERRPPSPPPPPKGERMESRWPLSAERAEFSGMSGGSSRTGVGRDLVGRLARMGLHTLALTVVLFFAVPRFGQVTIRGSIATPQTLVGFTDEVKLGELGKIIESREAVMQVQFLRGRSGNDVLPPLDGDVYLQGAYLMYYRNGQWRSGQPSRDFGGIGLLQRERKQPIVEIVRQKIVLDSMDRRELFYVAPYIATEREYPGITVDYRAMRLYRADHDCATRFPYTLGTTAIVNGEQLPLTPAAENDVQPESLPRSQLPNLVKLADRWIADSHLAKTDRVGRAQYLERKLALGDFQYSLTRVERDPNIDPIEDFLTKHRQGHCEYFATALTLMLRSQGIPARMVCGFKCDHDDWNSAGDYYQVRQWHAHTWVEAYLPSDQLPAKWLHGKDFWLHRLQPDSERCWEEGGWLRLDATPAGAAGERTDWLAPVRKGLDWLDGNWSKYVVELDYQPQRDAIYQPIADAARSLWQVATSARQWQSMFDSVAVALYLDHLGREAKWVLLGVVGVMLAVLLAGAGLLLVRIGRRLWGRSTGNHSRRRGRRSVEIAFYRRFEGLMARQGLVRAPAQTQHEFAAIAGVRLASLTGERRLAALPALIADAFYRVRFGRTPLDNLQTQAVEQALVEIAAIRKNVRPLARVASYKP